MKAWDTPVRRKQVLDGCRNFPAQLCFNVQSKEEHGEESQIDGDIIGVFVGTWKDVSRMRPTGCRMHLSEKPGGACR